MHECAGPLWPCGLTGAAACLSGIRGMGVIVHGSAGCYFYPSTVLHVPLHCTSLSDQDIIHGTDEALFRTIDSLKEKYSRLSVLCTCIPAITGEDIRGILEDRYGDSARILVLDAPGFTGEYEEGFLAAVSALQFPPSDNPGNSVNIDGLSLMDPFWRGNLQEIERLLRLAGAGCGATLCAGRITLDATLSSFTVHANPDLCSAHGDSFGSMLGMSAIPGTIALLEDRFGDCGGVLSEHALPDAEERIVSSCDRYLKRFDPPRVALFGESASMTEIASMLTDYLGVEILGIWSRNTAIPGMHPVEMVRDYGGVRDILERERPDLILGSSFEQVAFPSAAFVGVTPPLRGMVKLHARPIAGIEGALALMESVLNACIDSRKPSTSCIRC